MHSMTGFGSAVFIAGPRAYRLELRSYNNRFLDVKVHLPWASGALEGRALKVVRGSGIHRGRLEISVWEERGPNRDVHLHLDQKLAQELGEILGQLSEKLSCDLTTAASLVQPFKELVVEEATPMEPDEIWRAMEPGLTDALDHLLRMRGREGQELSSDIARNLDGVDRIRTKIHALAQQEPVRLQDRLMERLKKLGLSSTETEIVDPVRLAQEVAHFADRCDISEELARLESHSLQLRTMLQQQEPVGRKIEFMLQELNRELNTIASKTYSTDIAHHVVEAKALAEKMREQAQNVE